jgi:hypothetical protein
MSLPMREAVAMHDYFVLKYLPQGIFVIYCGGEHSAPWAYKKPHQRDCALCGNRSVAENVK